jgi:hypothetical protein
MPCGEHGPVFGAPQDFHASLKPYTIQTKVFFHSAEFLYPDLI